VEHRKEDESPFDFSEDGPPALDDVMSEKHEKVRDDHTDIIHGAVV
jgi:hypothetical protein